MNEMRKLMEAVSSLDLLDEFNEEYVTEPLGDYWDSGYDVSSSIEQVDNYPAHPMTVKALTDIPGMYMKAGDQLELRPTNEMGEVYSEENGLTYDWDAIFHMHEMGRLELYVGPNESPTQQHVPYVEEEATEVKGWGDDSGEADINGIVNELAHYIAEQTLANMNLTHKTAHDVRRIAPQYAEGIAARLVNDLHNEIDVQIQAYIDDFVDNEPY